MVRNIVIAACLLGTASQQVMAQNYDISVKMDVPMPNTLSWNDIWNVSISNGMANTGMPTTVDVRVELSKNEIIYEAVTGKFIVPVGITRLNTAIAGAKSMEVLTEDAAGKAFFTRYNEMPDGTYRLCVTLKLYNPIGAVLYSTDDCLFHEIAHPGVIILNTPMNGDTVLSELLQFTWTHVNERSQSIDPSYQLDLVELLPGQSPETGIVVNSTRLRADGLAEPVLDYPQLERPLDTGLTYAWKVTAYTDTRSTTRDQGGTQVFSSKGGSRQEIARSDVGYFVCGHERTPSRERPSEPANFFIDLDRGPEGQTYYFDSSLPLSVTNPYGRRSLSFQLYDDRHEAVELSLPAIPLTPGLNQVRIDLSREALDAGRLYFAELSLGGERVYSIKLFRQRAD